MESLKGSPSVTLPWPTKEQVGNDNVRMLLKFMGFIVGSALSVMLDFEGWPIFFGTSIGLGLFANMPEHPDSEEEKKEAQKK